MGDSLKESLVLIFQTVRVHKHACEDVCFVKRDSGILVGKSMDLPRENTRTQSFRKFLVLYSMTPTFFCLRKLFDVQASLQTSI